MNTIDIKKFISFRDSGCLILENVLDSDQIGVLSNACDEILRERSLIGGGEDPRFLQQRHNEFPAIREFVMGDEMRALSNLLLVGTPYLYNEKFSIRKPGSAANLTWRRDSQYVGFEHKPFLTICCLLDDVSEANGCIYVLPKNAGLEASQGAPELQASVNERTGYVECATGVAAVAPAGSLVAYCSTSYYCSGANQTDMPRRSYDIQYSPAPIIVPQTKKPQHFAIRLGRSTDLDDAKD